MPELKQVVPLHEIAWDVFLESVLQCFERLIGTGDEDLFRRGVISVRERIKCLPGPSLAEFASRFPLKFRPYAYRELDYQIGLEVIMDIEIVGLRLVGRNLNPLILQTAHRFPTLKELDLGTAENGIFRRASLDLSIFNLNDLTTLMYVGSCTDSDSIIIGEHCRHLEVLKVSYSKHVTDAGLVAISHCLNLRVVHFRECLNLTHRGFNHMLSVHKKLEDFYYGCVGFYKSPPTDCNNDVSSSLDPSVEVLSLNRLVIEIFQKGVSALNLEAIVKKFPNLIDLRIHCGSVENIYALKYLNRLTGIETQLAEIRSEETEQTWRHLEDVFRSIGPNITYLSLGTMGVNNAAFACRQEQLDMISDRCGNLEHLEFDYNGGSLVVPEFANLKVLTPRTSFGNQAFQFGRMLNLQVLTLPDDIDLKTVKSIMFDNDKFPKLSVLKVSPRTQSDIGKEVKRISRDSNLDFRVEKCDYPSHIYSDSQIISNDLRANLAPPFPSNYPRPVYLPHGDPLWCDSFGCLQFRGYR